LNKVNSFNGAVKINRRVFKRDCLFKLISYRLSLLAKKFQHKAAIDFCGKFFKPYISICNEEEKKLAAK
jgi:hypothetical protein